MTDSDTLSGSRADARLGPVLERIDAGLEPALERLKALLAIPSVSTDPAHAADCRRAADWLVADLDAIGFEARRADTPGHPMVLARGGPQDGPRYLFYGHYDVQPADPLELWTRDPFDPVVEETARGRVIRARGASDDKGQLMTFVEACRAWVAVHGALPCGLTLFFEGEEESGSPSLVPFLRENAEALAADVALICDTGLFAGRVPAIVTQLRGMLQEEIVVTAASRDLHSGMYGGAAMNPIRVLAGVIAALHGPDGRVQVPGFYDGVLELSPEMRADWEALGFDHRAFLGAVGLSDLAGEEGRSALEMLWSRPTAEPNGIAGGYAGEGFKTVLPAQASAKVSFRLVGEQDPHTIRERFRDWVRAMIPADCAVEFIGHGASPASRMDISHPAFGRTRAALGAEWGAEAAYVGSGGSIPVAGYFRSELGLDTILTGWSRDDDGLHAPNEKYDVESFHKGMRSWARVLAALS